MWCAPSRMTAGVSLLPITATSAPRELGAKKKHPVSMKCIKVFEEGYGEKLFAKVSPRLYSFILLYPFALSHIRRT